MTTSVAYEVHTFKNGQWMLDTVHDNKDSAIHEARNIYANRRQVSGVKVIKEEHESDSNKTKSFVVFKEEKGSEKKSKVKAKKPDEKKETVKPVTPAPEPKKKVSVTNYFLYLGLGLCAILLGIVAAAFLYTDVGK